MKILLYRFFLNKAGSGNQLTFGDFDKKIPSRNEHINNAFTFQREFLFRGRKYAYVFKRLEGKYVYGKIGRMSQIDRILPPESGFEDMLEEHWPNSDVYIRKDSDPEKGQTIALQYNSNATTSPLGVLRAWADNINQRLCEFGYVLSINPITIKKSFWQIVEDAKGHIQEVSFALNTPNLFKLQDTLSEDLKSLERETNVAKTTISLANPTGKIKLNDNNELIGQCVNYIENGGGEYKLKINGKVHCSKDKGLTKKMDVSVDLESKTPKAFQKALETITEIFK